nr:hypothetical protein [Angustibacter aerolatus]
MARALGRSERLLAMVEPRRGGGVRGDGRRQRLDQPGRTRHRVGAHAHQRRRPRPRRGALADGRGVPRRGLRPGSRRSCTTGAR